MTKYRMSKTPFIVFFVLALAACSSSQLFVDDAYHWPEKTNTGTTAISTENSAPAAATGTSAPGNSSSAATLEYISVQDTTITVRIKR